MHLYMYQWHCHFIVYSESVQTWHRRSFVPMACCMLLLLLSIFGHRLLWDRINSQLATDFAKNYFDSLVSRSGALPPTYGEHYALHVVRCMAQHTARSTWIAIAYNNNNNNNNSLASTLSPSMWNGTVFRITSCWMHGIHRGWIELVHLIKQMVNFIFLLVSCVHSYTDSLHSSCPLAMCGMALLIDRTTH